VDILADDVAAGQVSPSTSELLEGNIPPLLKTGSVVKIDGVVQ